MHEMNEMKISKIFPADKIFRYSKYTFFLISSGLSVDGWRYKFLNELLAEHRLRTNSDLKGTVTDD
jgi:hypothetical protein